MIDNTRGMTMRTLEGHKVNPANDKLTIEVVDEPGSGGANHIYRIVGFNPRPGDPLGAIGQLTIPFQNGPIVEAGVNGVTHEALIAILIDRLEAFQRGPFSNEFNERALGYLQAAQESLLARTRERMARNVEGTHQA